MAGKKIESWLTHEFSTGCYPGKDYTEFQSHARRDLRRICKENDLGLHAFNKSHYEFSAVLKHTGTGAFVYVSIPDVRFFRNEWYNSVLYRTMEHDKDWTGGGNNRCCWPELGERAAELVA